MIFGNKDTIAFNLHEKNEQFVIMDVIVNSVNISYQDNTYYVFPLVKNIRKEINFITKNDLFLDKILIGTPLTELHEIFYNSEVSVYNNKIETMDFLFYDISTQNAIFYVYQEKDFLIFFGKIIENDNIITTRIKKYEFLDTLSNLLNSVEPIAVPWKS